MFKLQKEFKMLTYNVTPRYRIKILPESAVARIMDNAKIPRECIFCKRDNENNVYFEKHYLIRPVHMDLNLYNNDPSNLVWMCEFHRLSYKAFLQGQKLRGIRVTKKSFNV